MSVLTTSRAEYDLISHMQEITLVIMSAVSISELKANLSRYVREVRRGGEVEVLDRGVPVARIVAVLHNSDGYDQSRERLIGSGVLRPGAGGARAVLDEPPLKLPVPISAALLEDRADRL